MDIEALSPQEKMKRFTDVTKANHKAKLELRKQRLSRRARRDQQWLDDEIQAEAEAPEADLPEEVREPSRFDLLVMLVDEDVTAEQRDWLMRAIGLSPANCVATGS